MRIIFLIGIIFSLINRSAVLPINIKSDDEAPKTESSIERRECAEYKKFVGSNLFDGSRKNCFSPEDVNLLVARREFEIMIPKSFPPDLLDDESVSHILRYFYYGFWLFRRLEDCNTRRIMEKAFYDTLGGFLRYYLVPVCKFSFYASKVELKTVRNVMMLYQKCRIFLNTNGNGWRAPMCNPLTELKSVKIEPIKIAGHEMFVDDDKCCSDLDLTTAPNNNMDVADDDMIIALPKIELEDSEGFLTNIWLPFSRKRTYNLRSCKSAFIVLKFYRSVSRCYKKKSKPQKCFDRKFRQWIVENVKMHLSDDRFYPGLGGILNVYENTLMGEAAEKTKPKVKKDDDGDTSTLNEKDTFDENERFDNIGKRNLNGTFLDEELLETEIPKTYGVVSKRMRREKQLICKPKCKKKKKKKMKLIVTSTKASIMTDKSSVETTTKAASTTMNHFIVSTSVKPKCKTSTTETSSIDKILTKTTVEPITNSTMKPITESTRVGDFIVSTSMKPKCKTSTTSEAPTIDKFTTETTVEPITTSTMEPLTNSTIGSTKQSITDKTITTTMKPKHSEKDQEAKSCPFLYTFAGIAGLLAVLFFIVLFLLLFTYCKGREILRKFFSKFKNRFRKSSDKSKKGKDKKAGKKTDKSAKKDKKGGKKESKKDTKKADKTAKKDGKKKEKDVKKSSKKGSEKSVKKDTKKVDKNAKKASKKGDKADKKDSKKGDKAAKKDTKKADKDAKKAAKKEEKKIKKSAPSKPRQPAGYMAKTIVTKKTGRTRQRRVNRVSRKRGAQDRSKNRSRSRSKSR